MSGGAADVAAAGVDAAILFEREGCQCCDCCEGYCPDQDQGSRWESFVEALIGGQEYVGTRMAVIRRDRLTGLPDDLNAMDVTGAKAAVIFRVPDETPPVFSGRHVAVLYDSLDRAGLACHHIEGDEIVHLYFNGEHVGWTRHAREGTGVTLDELGPIRRIAKAAWLPLNRAELAYREALAVDATS